MKEDYPINLPPVTDEETKKIEEILRLNPGEDYKESTLYLKDVTIDDFSKFLPYLGKVIKVNLTNCSISSFAELLKLEYCSVFYLDNVTFGNSDSTTIRAFPYQIRLSNMSFDAKWLSGLHLPSSSKGFKHLFINNCHVDNIQELSNIKGLYSLHIDKITFTHHPGKIKEQSIRMIHIFNTEFEDISFIPFKKSVEDIDFENCKIGSFEGISKFKKLEKIEIDTNTIVEDTKELENPFNTEIICHFVQAEKPFSLKNVLGLKNYIHQFNFTNFKEKTIDSLGKFEKVNKLSFEKSKFYVDAFLPIAKQIEKIDIRNSAIKKHIYFTHFSNLTNFDFSCTQDDMVDSRDFLKLLPLKKQLKELEFHESRDKSANYPIEKFTALESLKIGWKISLQTVESILTLKKLKRLELWIGKTKEIIDIRNLKNLEFLRIHSGSDFRCMGFEHLKRLKSLEISSDRKCNINKLPKMKSLKRLSFYSHEDCAVKGLSQFPNLEFLKLEHIQKLQLKTLKKLKVLDLRNSNTKDLSSIETLPSLEKLDLSCIQNNIDLTGISKFPNLKWLTLLESYEINDISALEPLKKIRAS
ncbi:hypothetical protein ACFOEQ_05395 [Chryseobacterium arachidis]|uniref:hypothetical protein n=1 Tax=Chryseobacterium arachidis TaxID=1416778 RepID=UPI0036193B64